MKLKKRTEYDDDDDEEEVDAEEDEGDAEVPETDENNISSFLKRKELPPIAPKVPTKMMKEVPEEKEWEFVMQPELAGYRNKEGRFLREHEALLELLNNISEILGILKDLK